MSLSAFGVGCDGGIGDGEVIGIGDTTPGPADVSPSDTLVDDVIADTAADLAEPDDVVPVDIAPDLDTTPDSTTEVIEPGPDGLCPALSACDEPLSDGRCEGACRDVDGSLVCRGAVVGGLCDMTGTEPRVTSLEPISFGDFTVIPVKVPARMTVGDTAAFEIRLRNDTTATIDVPFTWKRPGYWTFANVSWAEATGFRIPAGVTVALTADITAASTTLFDPYNTHIASFNFARENYEPFSVVDVADPDAIVCGGVRFPASWCRDGDCTGRQRYSFARCCNDVFFPAAQCCADADCDGGHCADGRCVSKAPLLGSANTLPVGNQRIVLVLVDSHPEFADDPCADRVDIVAEALQLATVDNWYHALAMRHLGRETMATKWTVIGGISSSDFLVGEDRFWYSFSASLDAWLADRGCPILGEYDKVLVSAPTLDLTGFGGVYFSKGEIGLINPFNPYLIAHELAHSFGATDLYLDLAGTFQYARDLMGNFLYPPPEPTDGVTWSEIGFADTDFDGVVDIARYMAFPEALVISDMKAIITARNSLEVSFEVNGASGDEIGRLVLETVSYALNDSPMAGQMWVQGTRHIVVFDDQQVDIPALEAAGTFGIHISGDYSFTDANWRAQTLVLDEALAVPVTRAP